MNFFCPVGCIVNHIAYQCVYSTLQDGISIYVKPGLSRKMWRGEVRMLTLKNKLIDLEYICD